jgi:hypothetical protein
VIVILLLYVTKCHNCVHALDAINFCVREFTLVCLAELAFLPDMKCRDVCSNNAVCEFVISLIQKEQNASFFG